MSNFFMSIKFLLLNKYYLDKGECHQIEVKNTIKSILREGHQK